LVDGLSEVGVPARLYETNDRDPWRSLLRVGAKVMGRSREETDRIQAVTLRKELQERPADLVIFVGAFFTSLPFYEEVASLESPPVVFAWDGDNHSFHDPERTVKYAPHIDILFTSDESLVPKLRDTFRQVEYLTFAANPSIHRDLGIDRAKSLYFCGERTAAREEMLTGALSGHPLTLCGKRWKGKGFSPPASWSVIPKNRAQEEMALEMNRHFAGINVHQLEHGTLSPVNMHTFEVPACGCLLICDERGTLPALFDAGEEILTFGSREELAEAAEFALKSDRAAALARAGTKRVLAEHTYAHRARTLLSFAGGS